MNNLVKKIEVLFLGILVSLVLFSFNFFVSASTFDTFYYFTDSPYVSVHDNIVVNYDNYCFIEHDPFLIESYSDTSDFVDNSNYLTNEASSTDMLNTKPNNCLVIFEFMYLLPDSGWLLDIMDKFKKDSCKIILIGSFSEYDYSYDDWCELEGEFDDFYEKYPEPNFLGYTFNGMFSINNTFDHARLYIDAGFISLSDNQICNYNYESDFSKYYKFSWFIRAYVNFIRRINNNYSDAYTLLSSNNMEIVISLKNLELKYLINNNTTFFDKDNPQLELNTYPSYQNFGVLMYNYDDLYSTFTRKLAALGLMDVFVLEIDPLPEGYNPHIHVYDGPAEKYALYQFYNEAVYNEADDEEIWNIIQIYR